MTGYENEKPVFTFGCSDSARFVFLVFNKAAVRLATCCALKAAATPALTPRVRRAIREPIYDLLNKMQAWNSTKLLIMKRQRLRDFAGDSLGRAVSKERGKTYYLRAQGCPGCNELASWGTFWPPKWDGWRTLLPGCRRDRPGIASAHLDVLPGQASGLRRSRRRQPPTGPRVTDTAEASMVP